MKRWRGILGLAVVCLAGCAPHQPPAPQPQPQPEVSEALAPTGPPALAEEPEALAPELRLGRIAPLEHKEPLLLEVRRHAIDGDEQLLEVPLPRFAAEVPGDRFWLGTEARLTGGSAPFQLVSRGKQGEMLLWLRRPKQEAQREVLGDAYTPALGGRPGNHFRFRAPAPGGEVAPALPAEWATAAVEYFRTQPGAFGISAATRLWTRYRLPGAPALSLGDAPGPLENELAFVDLMDTFSGRSSVQEALALRRGMIQAALKQPRSIPIEQLQAPQLSRHPWPELLRQLGRSAPEEPLARAVPADFYFLRADSFSGFSDLLQLAQSLGAPAADLLDGSSVERGSLSRYRAELGVETGDLSRVLGPEVIDDFAITGSDPYVHEGSDVTLVLRLKSPLLFRAALAKSLVAHGVAHGGTQSGSFVHEGVTVEVARSGDGRVRQHHATVAELELVSNSASAIRRVISTIHRKLPSLADEPDFRYMLARDAEVPAQVLGYVGERFVARVVGPAQKIAEARRQVALSELMAPSLAALLYGWVHGRSPASSAELLRSGLLMAAELRHRGGGRIDWVPGSAPRSSWGTPAALEPLIDLPAVTRVSAAERSSYRAFAQQYENHWREYIDPIAVRIASQAQTAGLHAELRVLPLVAAEDALRFDTGADGRVAPPELAEGVRFSLGIGKQAGLRQGLSRALSLFGGRGIQLDWLGEYAMLGFADRNELLRAALSNQEAQSLRLERPPAPDELGRQDVAADDIELLRGMPAYMVIALRSRVAAAVALTAARQMAESAAPGAFEWAPFAAHRGVEVVRVLMRERELEIPLYYALARDSLIVSFNRSLMRSLIDQAVEGKLPKQGQPRELMAKQGQVVVELSPRRRGALHQLMGWMLTAASLEAGRNARAAAEAVLRGVPESAHKPERSAELARAYLGAIPLTPDGRYYFLGADGVTDPLRGTLHAPNWPELPTPDSAADRVLSSFSRLRSDLSFDDEPVVSGGSGRLRSLRARLDLWLR